MNLPLWRLCNLFALVILALVGLITYLFIQQDIRSWSWNLLPSSSSSSRQFTYSSSSYLEERYIPKTFSLQTESSLLKESRNVPNESFVILTEASAPARRRRFGVSMFHQLHCLELLRGRIMGNNESEAHSHHHHENPLESQISPHYQDKHLQHCLDYLAQVST